MGLFSSNKKLCPVCKGPTPKLFSTKVEGMPICKECSTKVDLPDGVLDQMSLADFFEYLNCYEENQMWRDIFSETYSHFFGFTSGHFTEDENNRLFKLKGDKNAFAMQASQLKSFRILEETEVLFESAGNVLKYYTSTVPQRLNEMVPLISQFVLQRREYDLLEERAKREGTPLRHARPYFEMPVPFRHYYIELVLDHPYWREHRWEMSAPGLDRNYPNLDFYLDTYENQTKGLHELARHLMDLICPGAAEVCGDNEASVIYVQQVQPVQQVSAGEDVTEQLKKYKALVDAGVLTEEEFTAKKKQLLGI